MTARDYPMSKKPDLRLVVGDKKKHAAGEFGIVSLHVVRGPRLTWSEVQVWVIVSSRASIKKGNTAWPTQETIAREIGLHRNTVGLAIKRLVNLGHLAIESKKRVKGQWANLTYRVVFPADETP